MNQYHKLYTPADSAIVFIDHQPQMLFGVANADRATLINNVTLLAKVAKEFKVPAVLTAVETESFSGYVWPQLLDVFPGQPVVERTSMNSWRCVPPPLGRERRRATAEYPLKIRFPPPSARRALEFLRDFGEERDVVDQHGAIGIGYSEEICG